MPPSQMSSARLIFLGAPGVGKGTYASRLSSDWSIPHISTGDLIRSEIAAESSLGMECKAFIDEGHLAPDELVLALAKKHLSAISSKSDRASKNSGGGFILDGFPRTITQAEKMCDFVDLDFAIVFELPEKILLKKLSGRRICRHCGVSYNVASIDEDGYFMPPLLLHRQDGCCDTCGGADCLIQRDDDREDVIRERFKTHAEETRPLEEFYDKQKKLLRFDLKRGIEDLPIIRKAIEEALMLKRDDSPNPAA